MMNEVLCLKTVIPEQVAPHQRECPNWRFSLETGSNHNRLQWNLRRVIATSPGNDGLVRKASVCVIQLTFGRVEILTQWSNLLPQWAKNIVSDLP